MRGKQNGFILNPYRFSPQEAPQGQWVISSQTNVVVSLDGTRLHILDASAGFRAADFQNTGRHQFEIDVGSAPGDYPTVGIMRSVGNPATGNGWYAGNSWIVMRDGTTRSPFTGYESFIGFPAVCTVGFVVDSDTGIMDMYVNGVLKGTLFSTLAGETVAPLVGLSNNSPATFTLRTHGFTYPVVGADPWH